MIKRLYFSFTLGWMAFMIVGALAGPVGPPLECKGTITPIKTVLSPGPIQLGDKPSGLPEGQCSQIEITAWRTENDYSSNQPLTPHEKTKAVGRSLAQCTNSLKVPSFVMVKFVATTKIPGWKVVLSYRPSSSSTDPMIWEEKHPVVTNWHLRPSTMPGLHVMPTPPVIHPKTTPLKTR